MPAKRTNRRFKRILLKLSGEVLQGGNKTVSVDPKAVAETAKRLKRILKTKTQLAVVVGGGNIIRGAAGVAGVDRLHGDYMGMLSTVINALALKSGLEAEGVKVCIQSAVATGRFAEPISTEKAIRCLEEGRVVIFAGGTGNPFFTTDTTAALRASEVKADAVLKATKVDGVYTDDPEKNPKAKRYKKLAYREALEKKLGIMDAAAFSLCQENGLPIIVFNYFKKGSIMNVLSGKAEGTVIS